MQKRVGLSRSVRLDWLDAVASLCEAPCPIADIRRQLDQLLESAQPGAVERQRIIDTLVRIWVRAEPALQQAGLALYRQMDTRPARMGVHYGMVLAQYPFFRVCAAAIGQTGRTQETFTRVAIKRRAAAELGSLGSLERAIDRLFKTLEDWAVLAPVEGAERGQYRLQVQPAPLDKALELWLLGCALRAHPAQALPFEDLKYLPELFPFRFSLTVEDLRAGGFETQSQGGGLVMVRRGAPTL